METSKKTLQSGYGIGATYGPNYGIGATYGSTYVKKVKKLALSIGFFIFSIGDTF